MKAYRVMELLIFIIFLYDILPSFYFRYCSSSVIRRFHNDNSVYLTFDDGPNPDYTLQILDLLREYNVKATFFIIAEKAEKHKYILDRIVEEGHTLGIHSYSHRSAWLFTPWQTRKDFRDSILALEKLGYKIKYFRPPWGVFNLFTNYYSNKNGLRSVFWTIITRDWDPNATVENTVNSVLSRAKSGDIIVLHDSNHKIDDNKGAPKNTIEALKIILPALKERGFCFQTIEDGMEGSKKVGKNI